MPYRNMTRSFRSPYVVYDHFHGFFIVSLESRKPRIVHKPVEFHATLHFCIPYSCIQHFR